MQILPQENRQKQCTGGSFKNPLYHIRVVLNSNFGGKSGGLPGGWRHLATLRLPQICPTPEGEESGRIFRAFLGQKSNFRPKIAAVAFYRGPGLDRDNWWFLILNWIRHCYTVSDNSTYDTFLASLIRIREDTLGYVRVVHIIAIQTLPLSGLGWFFVWFCLALSLLCHDNTSL